MGEKSVNSARYRQVFARVFQVSEDELGPRFIFRHVNNWDSIAHMTLIAALEAEFELLLDTEEILNFCSFENGKRILGNHDVVFE